MALKACSGLICNDSVQLQMEMRKVSRRRPHSVEGTELGHCTLLGSLSNDDDDNDDDDAVDDA